MEVNATSNCLVKNILQNIIFCFQQKKQTHICLKQWQQNFNLFGELYLYNHMRYKNVCKFVYFTGFSWCKRITWTKRQKRRADIRYSERCTNLRYMLHMRVDIHFNTLSALVKYRTTWLPRGPRC